MITGRVAGATAVDRAVRIAGALAELGANRLELVEANGMRRTLKARETNLPDLLAARDAWTIQCAELRVSGDQNGAAWTARDAATAARARAALEA